MRTDLTAYAYGMMHYCAPGAEMVAEQDGISVEVDIRTLNPLDKDTILNSFRRPARR